MALPGISLDMASDKHGHVLPRCQNMMVLRKEPTQPANTFRIDAQAAEQHSQFLMFAVFVARETLLQILNGREAVLRKRWAKKNCKQRRKVLQDAWPNIPIRHRPDVQGILESLYPTKKQPLSTPLEDDAPYKWPHLNVEDLVHGQCLPLLINSRGRNHPIVFADSDLASCKVGLTNGKIKTAWCPEALGIGDKLLVLEIQQKLYEFLLECCCKIFSDITRDELLCKALPQQPEPETIETTDASYITLASVVTEAPFRVPATLDTGKLLRLVEAKRAAAEDQAWSIREDPGYFKHVLLAASLHRKEQVRDAKGNECDSLYSKSFWNHLVLEFVDSTYTALLMWDIFYDLTCALAAKTPKGSGNFDYRKPWPEDVTSLILDMFAVADRLALVARIALSQAVFASREMEERYVRVPNPQRTSDLSGKTCVHAMQRKDQYPVKDDPFMRIFELLFDPGVERIGMHPLVDEIQRIIQSDRRQAKRLSPFVADLFSEIALMTNICRVLEGLLPGALKFGWVRLKQEGLKCMDSPQLKLLHVVHKTFHKDNETPTGASEIGLPLPIKDSLEYPIHKVYSEQNVESLRRAEWNLDTFWNKWDYFFFSHTGETLNDILRQYSKGPRAIRRTLPYRPIERRKATTPSPAIQVPSIAYQAQESERPRWLAVEPPRAKIKTRGVCNSPTGDEREEINEDADVPVPDADEKSREVTFKLKDRALKVFRTLFYTEGSSEHQGEVDWKNFSMP
ncbi:hypothetical protein LTR93_011258 [Exophiala xenobiotica]|nr:hypothetical protein LTR93_011258 [Exophiala xenobiotica]